MPQEKNHKGIIIEESLDNKDILQNVDILSTEISDDGEWHMHTVFISPEMFKDLSRSIKTGTWYMHFWKDREVVAIFRNKTFVFNFDDKKSWEPILEYGRSLGIPEAQLDFPIE